jgi:ubiquinol-cytochrome c reductase cytochrome c subunit
MNGRAAYELHCAACHQPAGVGGYLGPAARPPRIAGADVDEVVHHVREGGEVMPAFSPAELPDGTLQDLALYLHEGSHGERTLDPFAVGLIVWVALAFFTCGLAALLGAGER